MPYPVIDPVLVNIGPLPIRWYALAYISGILLGWRYILDLLKTEYLWGARKPLLSPVQLDDLILWITLGIIVGGRIGHVVFYTPQILLADPLEIFMVWHGGMSFHGGTLGVLIATLVFARLNKLDLYELGDLICAAAPLGLLFGRLANFIKPELWGRVTEVPWAMIFPGAGPLPRHPSQLYEAALEGVVLFLILRWGTHGAKLLQKRGVIAGLFFLGYGLIRVALENVREPDVGMPDFPLGLTMGMILSLPMILGGSWLIWRGITEDAPATPHGPA
ncbi:MAG: prolipoprotein diacylglyceryl transferase [Alphaproteobacteria bacterium]